MSSDGSTQRLGVTLASLPALGIEANISVAKQAQELGYQSCWTAETTGLEAFSTLAAVGAAAPGLNLGTGVLALQVRTPTLAAMGAATLQALHPERDVLLGLGISSPVVTERWHAAPYGTRPLSQVREYVTLVRELLEGDAVTFDGDHHSLKRARLGVRLGDRKPKLVIGALNRRMLALAGEVADGVLLNYLPAGAVPWCVEQVRSGEAAAGREPGSCTIYAYVHVGVCDREQALGLAQRDLFSYAVVDAYAEAFTRAGFGDEVEAVREAHARRDRDAALAAVSERMIDAIDILGDAATVRGAIEDYVTNGVDVPVLMPLPWGEDRVATVESTLRAAAGRH